MIHQPCTNCYYRYNADKGDVSCHSVSVDHGRCPRYVTEEDRLQRKLALLNLLDEMTAKVLSY